MDKLKKQLKAADFDAAIRFLIGIPIPITTIRSVLTLLINSLLNKNLNFVDWELNKWWEIYRENVRNSVSLKFKGNEIKIPSILVFDNTNLKLPLKNFRFKLSKEPFELTKKIKGYTEKPFNVLFKNLVKKGKFYNEKGLRLIELRINSKNMFDLTVQGVFFKDYVHTNLVLDAKNNKKTLRELIHINGKLEPLKESVLANNMGLNILLFTADDKLIIQKRSNKVAFRPGELCPSASGFFSDQDLPNLRSKRSVDFEEISKFLLREAIEELGIGEIAISNIELLGITRELIRGGQPEIFFSAMINNTEKEILDKWEYAIDKKESKELIFHKVNPRVLNAVDWAEDEIQMLAEEIEDLLNIENQKYSIPLMTAIALWNENLKKRKTPQNKA